MRKQSVLSVPSQAAASNRQIFARITFHHYFYKSSTCSAASTLRHFDRNNRFEINSSSQALRWHIKAQAPQGTQGKETIHFALTLTFLSTHKQQGSITQRARCKYLKDFLFFFFPFFLLPSWREYSRSKVTSHMP